MQSVRVIKIITAPILSLVLLGFLAAALAMGTMSAIIAVLWIVERLM